MKINPDYYAKSSLHVPEISFPAYASNANLLPPIAGGSIDWGGISIIGVPQNYLSKSRAITTWETSQPYFSDNNVVGPVLQHHEGAAERRQGAPGDQLRDQQAAAVD